MCVCGSDVKWEQQGSFWELYMRRTARSVSQSISKDLVLSRKRQISSRSQMRGLAFRKRRRYAPCSTSRVPTMPAKPMISQRNQEYSRVVVWEPECLVAPVVNPQATQTQPAPLNSKER